MYVARDESTKLWERARVIADEEKKIAATCSNTDEDG